VVSAVGEVKVSDWAATDVAAMKIPQAVPGAIHIPGHDRILLLMTTSLPSAMPRLSPDGPY
jgi:hypothetical protein